MIQINSKIAYIFFLSVLMIVSSQAFSQQGKGFVFVAVYPDNALIRIDTALIKSQHKNISLDTGSYVVKSWALGHQLLVDTIHIDDAKYLLYRRKLTPTQEYLHYKQEYKVYKMAKYIPLGIIGASAVYFGVQKIRYKNIADDNLDQAKKHKLEYEAATSPIDISIARSQYEEHRKNYEDAIDKGNTNTKMALIVLPAEIVATGLFYYLSDLLIKPVFSETALLSDLSIDYRFVGSETGVRLSYIKKF